MKFRVQNGFTLIEVLVTLVIMTLLLSLGMVALNSGRVQTRDAERKSDIETIARGLENYYNDGDPDHAFPSLAGSHLPAEALGTPALALARAACAAFALDAGLGLRESGVHHDRDPGRHGATGGVPVGVAVS